MTSPPAQTRAPRARAPRAAGPDAACLEAVELARAAAIALAGEPSVGEHLGIEVEGDRVLTHRFTCRDLGYRGWHWAVTVARASRAKLITVDEVVLLPGADAILSPEWVPWHQRLRPGDLGVGDLLHTPQDDPRLQPGWTPTGEDDDVLAAWEPGLGRARVLSGIGRDDAIDRWYEGESGPRTALAEAAPAACSTCAFPVALSGSLRRVFAVCANEYAPDDGKVVSWDHGCGAHSEAVVVPNAASMGAHALDELDVEVVHVIPQTHEEPADDLPAEELGHS